MVGLDVDEYVSAVTENEVVLFVVPSTFEYDLSTAMVTHFTRERDALCVYVTVSKPSQTINRRLSEADANTRNVFYVDCATALTGISVRRAGNVVYLKPSELTDISIALQSVIDELPSDREGILMFDTLSTLMIYNEADTVSRFAHALLSNIRHWPVKALVFTIDEETDPVVRSRLSQFSDRTVVVEN